MFLDDIVKEKIIEVEKLKSQMPQDVIKNKIIEGKCGVFLSAISALDETNIIAEIKKASPSKGIICKDFDPIRIAKDYEMAGAKALSVLTEKTFFQGDISHIGMVKKNVALPVLRKDFIVDEYQIYESALSGADAILLIVGILNDSQLEKFLSTAQSLGLDCLVEVHNEDEFRRCQNINPKIIGINNRDLKTFKVDIGVTGRLMTDFKFGKFGCWTDTPIIVSESGISSHKDIARLKKFGVNAFLIGESLLSSSSRVTKIKELLSE